MGDDPKVVVQQQPQAQSLSPVAEDKKPARKARSGKGGKGKVKTENESESGVKLVYQDDWVEIDYPSS